MSGHAATVRETLCLMNSMITSRERHSFESTEKFIEGATALAALEQELAEAKRELDFKKKALRNCREAHLAAEAELAEAKQRIAYLVAEAHGWQPRLAAAKAERDKLREALRLARQDIITVNTAAWDSERGKAALAAITAIDAALAEDTP